MDLLGDIHRLTSGLLRGLIADGTLPADVDLGRFSVRVPGAGTPRRATRGDALVDAASVYAREFAETSPRTSPHTAPGALAEALAAGLAARPEVAGVAVAGGGLLVVTLHPATIRAAVAAVLRAAGPARPRGGGAAAPPVRWPAGTAPEASIRRARAEAMGDILASLAAAAGLGRGDPARAPPPPVGPVVLRGRRPGIGAGGSGTAPAELPGDSFRFAVASRRRDAVLDLDPSALGDRARADPAFWVAYAHARARAVLRRAAAVLPGVDLSPAALAAADLSRLTDPGEQALARLVALGGAVVAGAAAVGAPQGLAAHLRDLADAVHSQWNRSKDQPQLRFVNEEQRDLTKARLALVTASALVLQSGLDIFGIAAPDEMR